MRIVFLQDRAYFSWNAGVKINRCLAHLLGERGWRVRAAVSLIGPEGQCEDPPSNPTCRLVDEDENCLCLEDNGTQVVACRRIEDYGAVARATVLRFRPDVILFSESQTYRNMASLPDDYRKRCVVAVHCTEVLPFGPFSVFPDNRALELMKTAGGAVVVCQFLRNYLWTYGGIESVALPFPGYGGGPFPDFSSFERGLVLMVNPSEIKGLTIFVELAKAFPDVEFGAVRSWATSDSAVAAIRTVPNIRMIEPHPDIDTILDRTRILLAPSLWQEAFPVIVIEAMLRGIPVIASRVGGLPEAKLGTDFVIPVNAICEWELGIEAGKVSVNPKVPRQDLAPWISALKKLVCSREEYETLSRASRRAALDFHAGIHIDEFERYFSEVVARY